MALVYIAGKTSEAKAVEKLLTEYGITYMVKSTPFMRSSIFGGLIELPGVGFYVPVGEATHCRSQLQDHKFKVGLVMEGEE